MSYGLSMGALSNGAWLGASSETTTILLRCHDREIAVDGGLAVGVEPPCARANSSGGSGISIAVVLFCACLRGRVSAASDCCSVGPSANGYDHHAVRRGFARAGPRPRSAQFLLWLHWLKVTPAEAWLFLLLAVGAERLEVGDEVADVCSPFVLEQSGRGSG